jgi:hypothetical protein
VASVTIDRIDASRRHIADAVTQTSERSTLPVQEQDRILEQACGEACELLVDWLRGQGAESSAADDVPLRELLRDQQQFTDFLSPLFADAIKQATKSMKRASGDDADDSAAMVKAAHDAAIVKAAHEEVARAVRAASATARRFPRMRSGQLFKVATENVSKLKDQVCDLATQLGDARRLATQVGYASEQAAGRAGRLRRTARKVLPKVGGFLLGLSVSLALSVAGPRQVIQNVSAWTHGVPVVMAHYLAATAQPGITIAPPHAGPSLR